MVVRVEGTRWLTGSGMRARTKPGGRAACSEQANAVRSERSPALVIAMQVVEVSPVRVTEAPAVDNPEPAIAVLVEGMLAAEAPAREAMRARIVVEAETGSETAVFPAAEDLVVRLVAARVDPTEAAHGPAAPVVHPAWEAPVAVPGVAVVDAGVEVTKK
jgi:hypothetical protein